MPKVQHTRDSAEQIAKSAIPRDIWKELERHLAGAEIRWVGHRQPDGFYKDMLMATCMHDLAGVAYGPITRFYHSKFECSDKSIQTNVKRCRLALSEWGQNLIRWPTRADSNRAVEDVIIPDWMGNLRWWMDSCDVPTAYLSGVRSPAGEWWSGKEGCPARRYMVLADGSQMIRMAWGGYSPKVYDAHFLRVVRPFLEERCAGTSIIGDTHFSSAADVITDPHIIATPTPNAGIDLLRRRNFAHDTAEAEVRRAQVASVRGIVEQVFADVKQISNFLAAGPYCKWQDAPDELDHVFYFACGVHNKKIMNRRRVA